MMSLHKLTAGDGYTYLTRQVATVDSTERGYSSLGDYYAAKGEAPGVWVGSQAAEMGLAGTAVSEEQMKNLFGAGLHPDAQRLEAEALAALPTKGSKQSKERTVDRAGKLGHKFSVYEASPVWHENLAAAYQQYNQAQGLAKSDKVPELVKPRIRTQVGTAMFTAQYGREPHQEHELAGFIAQQSRPATSAVAGYDLTFSPVKSVSTLWAIASREVAEQLEAAHNAAVQGTLLWLEKEAGYTREGTDGVGQIRIRGFLATAFTHRDSRAGDPDLHTHVAVSNKVQTPEGKWRALDARMLYRYNVPASEQYNLLLEAEVTQRIGGQFQERGDGAEGKREIRELVGVPAALNEHFSSRRVMIEGHRAVLVGKFTADHGRVPTAIERIALSQQATLATRQAKHEPISLAEQRALWQSYPQEICAQSPAQILAEVTGQQVEYADVTPGLLAELTGRVVETVAGSRAQWRDNNLSAEARRQVKAAGIHPDQMADLAAQVTTAAVGLDYSIPIGMDTEIDQPTPAALLDVDGKAVFRVAKGQLYTCPAILAAESRIVAAAGLSDAWALSDTDVELAHLEWSANNDGRTLNTGQEAMVRQVATSGKRMQLVFGPAGTGKTTSLAVLSLAAQSHGITVVGLAPQASAAQELAAAVPGITSETLHKLVWELTQGDPDWVPDESISGSSAPAAEMQWISDIGPQSLVIIDEAGLAGTKELDVAVRYITSVGGRVLLVGDDRQRAAHGAGGVLRDIESTHGALMLDEVMRFQDRGIAGAGSLHGRATLALRAGDPGAVGYYADRNLIRPVTPDTAAAQVFTGWQADVAAGADSIMIAPTLDMVADLNGRARAARIAATGGTTGPERSLARGERVSAGDLIVTKKNKRVLSMGGTDFVRNNYRWRVKAVNSDGSITATEVTRGLTRTIPAWYVDKGWVRLGYAHTEASVQGMTVGSRDQVGTAHAIFTDATNRNQLYTSLSRATDRTTSYGVIPGSGDSHEVTTPGAVTPETVLEMFTAAVGRDGSDRSATTTVREAADPVFRLGAPGNAALAYTHAIVTGSLALVGAERMQLIADTVEVLVPGVTTAPAWETLKGHLATIAANGKDPVKALADAAYGRELKTAADKAAVLDFRLDRTGNHSLGAGPLPYLPAMPTALLDQDVWNTYLPARSGLVAELAQQVRDRAFSWTLDDAPAWAVPYLPGGNLVADLAVWRAAHAVPDTDLRPAGPRPLRLAERTWHKDFTDRAIAVAGDPASGADRWATLLTEQHQLNVAEDDWFPVLAARLTLAEAAGLDVPTLLTEAINQHDPLPAQIPAKALWWRLEPHLGSLTAEHVLPASGHRLRPVWAGVLEENLGELDAERVMSDRLWPTIVTHVDRAIRQGQSATLILPAAAGLFASARSTLGPHEMATVLLWQISTVTQPAPADPDWDETYPDPASEDLLVPAGAHQLIDADHARRTDQIAPAATGEPDVEFDVDRYAATAALIDAAYADLPLLEPADEAEWAASPDGEPDDDLPPADLYDQAPAPVREWITPEPPTTTPTVMVDPDVAPVIMRTDEQAVALGRARAALTAAQSFWTEQTPGSWVPDYITSRGLDPAEFLYAPAGWTRTMNHLMRQGFTQDELKAAGLITMSVRGTYVDLFQDRAVTGIHDPDTGEVVAFTGRKNPASSSERAPKYVNSPTTDLFAKSALPFGLTPANLAALRAGADLAIVEGPMDALAVNQAFAGDRAVVALAASGVAFTADHIATINQAAPNLDRRWLLVLDEDTAGQKASVKIYLTLVAAGVTHPDTVSGLAGKDPAEMLQTQGASALRGAFDARRPLAEQVIDTLIAKTDLSNGWVESRWQAMSDVAPFIAALPRDQIIDQTLRAAEIIGWDTSRAIDMVATHIPDNPTPTRPTADPGDLGLPPLPRLSTTPRPDPASGPTAGPGGAGDEGTVLTRAHTDTALDLQSQAPDWDSSDLEAAALLIVTEEPHVVAEPDPEPAKHVDVEPAETEIDRAAPTTATAAVLNIDIEVDRLPDAEDHTPTETGAALAWLEATDPDAHSLYLQMQAVAGEQETAEATAELLTKYRTHIAAEPDQPAEDLAREVAHSADDRQPQVPVESATVAPTADEDEELAGGRSSAVRVPGEHQQLPDDVLAEQHHQAAAQLAAMARIRVAFEVEKAETDQAIDGRHTVRLQQRVEQLRQQWQDVKSVQAADRDFEKAAEAFTRNAVIRVDLTEELAGLGAFAGRRKAQLAERLTALDVDDAALREAVMDARDRIDPKVRAALGTAEAQQRVRGAVRQIREQLPDLRAQAGEQDLEERSHAQARLDRVSVRETRAQDELAALTAEQQYRLANPDPQAEQRRRELYSQEQDQDMAAGYGLDRDWEPPPAPDLGMER